MLRYRQWRAVIAEYVADRLSVDSETLIPRTIGHLSLGLALSAYEAWLSDPESELPALIDATFRVLYEHLHGISE